MTTPTIDTQTDTTESFFEWIEGNSRLVTIGAVIVVVAAIGFWSVRRFQADRISTANKGLARATSDLGVGNMTLGLSDLTRLVGDYGGTMAGAQGAMMLAQLNFDQGKFDDGVKTLQTELGKAPSVAVPEIRELIGDGLLSAGKSVDAAKSYEEAATATTMSGERSKERAKAARAYAIAGDTAKARQIWTDLAADTKDAGTAAEAHVRLGEMDAKPAGKG